MVARMNAAGVALGVVLALPATAQMESRAPDFCDSITEFASFLAPFVLPKVAQDDFRLRDFICSEEFAAIRSCRGDRYAVDALFAEAMRLSWNNVYEALFISLLATMDHRRFGIKVPLLGPIVWVPLTAEFPEDFDRRVAALPRRLYEDSPSGGVGDRDKLQHFFGSAFITYLFESRDAAERIGEFIEWGEDKIIVDGALDERDVRANRHGQEFALRLLEDKRAVPSSFLQFVLAERDTLAQEQDAVPCGFFHCREMR